jgi:tetratricopeptide (TPR) repeat protein
LLRQSPDTGDYHFEISNLLAWLSDARQAQGRLHAALQAREKQLALLRKRLAEGPDNVQLEEQFLVAQRARGRLLLDTGQPRMALDQFRQAMSKARDLLGAEADNATWKGIAAGVQLDLADTLRELGRTSAASAEARAACAQVTALRRQNPNMAAWHSAHTTCLMVRSRLAIARGANSEALALARQAVNSARRERSLDPVRDRFAVAAALRLEGEAHYRLGDAAAAARAWTAALSHLSAKVEERPRELNERVALLRHLGREEEARPLAERLRAAGFRRMD